MTNGTLKCRRIASGNRTFSRSPVSLLVIALSMTACGSGGSSTTSGAPGGTVDSELPDSSLPDSPDTTLDNNGLRGLLGLDERPINNACFAPGRPTSGSRVKLERVWPGLTFDNPLKLLQAPATPDAEGRWFVLEQAGKVLSFDGSDGAAANATVALDYTDGSGAEVQIDDAQDAGLLGMTFHPDYVSTGEAFLSYTVESEVDDVRHVSKVTRIRSLDEGRTFDSATETTVLAIDQPFLFHNVGDLGFGPDGYLYIGSGDGGSAGDPLDHAQNPDSLLGKFLRIDVNSSSTYSIPPGNPFANGGGRPEIFALGLRNPWRWSFDRFTGALWAGDVGQSSEEEINVVRVGENYGWRCREGNLSFDESTCRDGNIHTAPVVSYGHDEGGSVTGGYVYRGSAIPALFGDYLYGDFISGVIWALTADDDGAYQRRELVRSDLGIASFSEGNDGELYVVDYFGGGLYKIVSDTPDMRFTGPAPLLSRSGCVDPASPWVPAPGVIPYGVRHPFWSNGVDKERFVALPDGVSAELTAEGDVDFPIDTVLMKHFRLGDQLIETRLFVRHDDGGWAGYSYQWNEAQTDAVLLAGARQRRVGEQLWQYPSRSQCLECHTEAAGFSLGPEVRQLDAGYRYPATQREGNQVDTLHHIGIFSEAATESMRASLLQPLDATSASVSIRARSYLHVNCASCHRPGATTRSDMDLRFDTPMTQAGVCDTEPSQTSLGLSNPRLIAPGSPDNSVLLARMQASSENRMPPIGIGQVDQEAVDLLREWIRQGADCPA